MHLILASGSPRRRALLESLGVSFTVCPSDIDETPLPDETPAQTALRLAALKARTAARSYPENLVLAADTVVDVDGVSLAKPGSENEMRRHLQALSGRTHSVYTALCLIDGATGRTATGIEETKVHFDALSKEQIEWYVKSGEGWDKAGSYGYQGLASVLIPKIEGCYFNVVGLPLAKLRGMMQELGYNLLQNQNPLAR